jgi:hypothetical protein
VNQLDLFGDEIIPKSASRPVRAIDPDQTTNGQRVMDLARLGYLPDPVLDPTIGWEAGMWKKYQPDVLIGSDLFADRHAAVMASFMALPFSDNAFASSLFDPPYKFHGGTSGDEMQTRFGVDRPHTIPEIREFYEVGAVECARVSREYVIVKCQDQVCGGKKHWQTIWVHNAMAAVGWRQRDMMHLANWTGLEQQERAQQHIRGNYSTFLIFVPQNQKETP